MKATVTYCREHRTYCGKQYMTVDLFQHSEAKQQGERKRRNPREKVTPPANEKLNNKRARRYLALLMSGNFDGSGLHISLTYNNDNLPESEEQAEREIKNYLRRVKRYRKKLGLPELKYILVTETESKRTEGKARIHHHIVMNGGVDRDDLELLWSTGRIDWKKANSEDRAVRTAYREQAMRRSRGFVNSDRLQPKENGLEELAKYLTEKRSRKKKRWSCSQNLERPERTTSDAKYTVRQLEKVCASGDIYSREWWEKKYPGYTLAGSAEQAVEVQPPDEFNNWIVYAKMRKVERGKAPGLLRGLG